MNFQESVMDNIFYDLKELFAESGCPICALKRRFEERYLDGLLYENVNDPGVRDRIRSQGGFCREHVRSLFDLRPSVLGISIIYDDVLRAYLHTNNSLNGSCPLCAAWAEKERFIQVVIEKQWHELKSVWGERTFLCHWHFTHIRWDESVKADLRQFSLNTLHRLSQDVSSLIRKFDYRVKKDTITPGESSSWQEILEFFGGRRLRNGSLDRRHF